jgi:hypothetical protein
MTICQLPVRDLWNLYNTCKELRDCTVPFLFRSIEIRFEGSIPAKLNSRRLTSPPTRLLELLSDCAIHVREIDVWGDEDEIEQQFIDLLPRFTSLSGFR